MICLSSDRRQQQLQNALDEAVKNDEMCTNLNYQAGKSFCVVMKVNQQRGLELLLLNCENRLFKARSVHQNYGDGRRKVPEAA